MMKTALVLSGGGARGAYEMGVWKALREMGVKIDVVTGTSIGAMNAALVAQDAYEVGEHFWTTLETAQVFDYKHAVENKGVRFTTIKDVLGEKLSEEAIRKSPVDMGIVTVELDGVNMTPVHRWKEDIPEGQLFDYVFASCSCFPVVAPYEIDGNKYIDGGFTDHMPMGMAMEKKPDRIIAVDLGCIGKFRRDELEAAADITVLIESRWDLGSMTNFNPEHAKYLMRIGYLDTFKAFEAFAGRKYTFFRAQFNVRNMKAIEKAAEIFDLDPLVVYSREVFLDRLKTEIRKTRSDARSALQIENFLLKGLRPAELLRTVRDAGEIGLLAVCDLFKKEPDIKIPNAVKNLLGDYIAAAQWIISEGLLDEDPEKAKNQSEEQL